MLPAPQVFEGPAAVRELRLMGLDPAVLASVLRAAHADAAQTTDNDSPMASGTIRWLSTLRYLRDALAPDGWDRVNDANYCLTVSPDHGRAIVVWAGTDATGNRHKIPSCRNAKGPRTIQSVVGNQLMLNGFGRRVCGPARATTIHTRDLGSALRIRPTGPAVACRVVLAH